MAVPFGSRRAMGADPNNSSTSGSNSPSPVGSSSGSFSYNTPPADHRSFSLSTADHQQDTHKSPPVPRSKTMPDMPPQKNELTASFDKIWKPFKSKFGKKSDERNPEEDMIEEITEEEAPKEDETDFSEPDQPDLIFVSSTGKVPVVKAGTEDRLIERLISEKYPGLTFDFDLLIFF